MLNKLVEKMRFVYTYVALVRNPERLDLVFALADRVTDTEEPLPLFHRPEVVAFLRRPEQDLSIDLNVLGKLPAGTLGRELADWFQRKGFAPDALDRKQRGSDRARVKRHLERTHDIWHVVVGFDTDVAGEVGLQAFYLAQLDSPVPLVLLSTAFLNSLINQNQDAARRMDAVTRGWLLGKRSKPLFGLDWSALWDVPLDQVRLRLGMVEPGAGARAQGAPRVQGAVRVQGAARAQSAA